MDTPPAEYDQWCQERLEQLRREKCERLQREVAAEEAERQRNLPVYEAEAQRLAAEIETAVVDFSDRWQYRKGLRLSFLGAELRNDAYRQKGLQFYRLCCERPSDFEAERVNK